MNKNKIFELDDSSLEYMIKGMEYSFWEEILKVLKRYKLDVEN